jgi:4-phosphopantoate---beta-alanine ligase
MSKEIPEDHPRAQSLKIRHKITDALKDLVVTEAGLIAQGRGEAWDYLIGEQSNSNSLKAIQAAVASLLVAKHSIISVNGNAAALCPKELVELSNLTNAKLEINIFYSMPGRIEAITKVLRQAGASEILGINENERVTIKELSSNRRYVDPKGIKVADVVMVPLEDGDRTEALVKEKKKVIAIDLNPLSRTAQMADITIVDNIVRVIPKMIEIAQEFKKSKITNEELLKIVQNFDNTKNLSNAIKIIVKYLKKLSKKGKFIEI